LIGLFLSYLQFKVSTAHVEHRLRITKEDTGSSLENLNEGTPSTKFEISKDGIKIDSAVIGLVILVVSITFFFLYLRYVFPIQNPAN